MNFDEKNPPRVFAVGANRQIDIKDCGVVALEADEQVTFVSPEGREYDLAAKEWGFYATPSMNGRLRDQGFKTALVRNSIGRYFVMIVDLNKTDLFQSYLDEEEQTIVEWLDERE